jgi:uncharacterized protein (TIGR03083 family)
MANDDTWPTIDAERQALATDLRGIPDDQWTLRTLCTDWTVQDLLAHMTATAKITPASFFPKLIGSGFSFNRLQAKDIARERGASPAETLANFESVLTSRKRPPGPVETMLGECIIHPEDIRRALGIKHDYPTAAVARVATFYTGSNLIVGAKKRIAGVRLVATDADWSHGDGPEARGPVLSILLAMTGRKPALEDLEGDGVATLRTR